MGKPYFKFKRFTIHQDKCAMKVGTDGVLLGAWSRIEKAERILDVGTGTGLIALMCAQRNPEAEIWAIDIDRNSYEQAKENFDNSDFEEHLHAAHCSLQEFRYEKGFDSIICNPPFFSAGTPSPVYERYLARHADSLPLDILIDYARKALNTDGILHLILPIDKQEELYDHCQKASMNITRQCVVYPSSQRPAKRLLVECSETSEERVEEELTIEKAERFDYTDAFIDLTKSFYLNMP